MTLPASFTSALLCAALTAACSQSGTPRVFNSNEPELGGTSLSMVQPKTMDCREPSRPEAERPTDSALGIWPAPSRLEFSSQSPDQVLFDALRHYDVKFREIRVCVSGNNARVMIVAMDDGTESLAWMHVASWGWSVDEVRPDNLSITYQRERGTSQPLELTTSRLVGEAVSISDDGGPLRSVGPWNVTTGGVYGHAPARTFDSYYLARARDWFSNDTEHRNASSQRLILSPWPPAAAVGVVMPFAFITARPKPRSTVGRLVTGFAGRWAWSGLFVVDDWDGRFGRGALK